MQKETYWFCGVCQVAFKIYQDEIQALGRPFHTHDETTTALMQLSLDDLRNLPSDVHWRLLAGEGSKQLPPRQRKQSRRRAIITNTRLNEVMEGIREKGW